MPSKAAERINFGKIKEVITPPNLIEVQNNSYAEFLQSDIDPKKRKNLGLQAVFSEVFPIESYDGKCVLDFSHYEIGEPKLDWLECLREGITYGAPLHVSFRLKDEQGTKEEKVFMGELPLITPQGSFVINGAERVIVSQLHRSPGLAFEASQHPNGKTMHSFRIIPDRGSWYEAQFDTNDLLFVYLDRKKRRRKFLTTTFFRALGYGSDADILRLFYDIDEISVKAATGMDDIQNKVLIEDILDLDKGAVVARAFEPMSAAVVREIANMGLKKIKVVDTSVDDGIIIKCLKKDPTTNEEEALKDIYRRLRPGDPPTAANARALLKRLFFDAKRYDLGRVGRYKISQKLNLDSNNESRVLEKEDLVAATKYLLKLKKGEGTLDDIDHLGSRRVRTVGELLANQCRVGLARTERLVKERMTLFDQGLDTMTPQKLINPKALSAVIRDFFGRSQLSQFMDQINPLAELTHKRRLSALGPGGLSRDRAGFEVRDVHPSHYGRICPIETPEGPNIGLIASLATFAKVNDFGFIETPYRKVVNGRVTSQLDYLTADREEQFIVAQANAPIDDKGKFQNERVMCRCKGDFIDVPPDRVDYMDVSPKQLVSVAAGLIPFLEHDDANRALMGSNMQRQAVPLLVSESPLVATGMESKVARDSCAVVSAEAPGVVASVSGNRVIITKDGKLPEGKKRIKHDPANDVYVYRLRKFMRSNAATCINQKVLVQNGQKIKAGDVIADGPSTEDGELALGKNVLCAFMPWNGYNFEDAILISQRIVKDDVYTSIHIDEYEVSARDTKLGPEEITRDIPNLGEDALKNLGLDGVIRVGAEVKPGDILVGKITPKSETELAPEERLLRAIFGEKAADVKDTSLKVPSGTYGIVMDVKVSAKKESERTVKVSTTESKKHSKQVEDEHKKKIDDLREQLTESLSNILLGEKIPLDVVNSETGEIIIPANRKITKTLLRKLASVYDRIEIDPSPIRNKINEIISAYKKRFDDLQMQHDEEMERVESGDDMETGIIKSVKVFIASKRKLSVGDKMAGRHGNKGVVAKIVAEEDMPFLANGTPVDIVLNPLGVPSRMNVGQLLETHLGWAAKVLGMKFATPVFDGIKESEVRGYLKEAGLPEHAKIHLYDGRTGERFDQEIVVGFIYMLKLGHLVADKIHARAVGPYSLVTQQPLGGKAQYGGQRFGEMEVWAMEAYGAAYALQELLTVKSDDVQGRTRIYESIVKGDNSLDAGIPESFNVLVKEIQSLGMDVNVGYEPEEVDPDAELRSVPSSLSAMG
ncbi:MAG: DNA-directed RNA polymerase subunit beta [Limisphaerales bacterium]|nr:DNA-directed RNA polymerase subunit beta [Pedosphaera sp.]RZO73001.1 MAG: DNA-directed RNA polymerase subunit beta [Limisphaerales bacterium]HCZ04156.1 DNA-directed RNA polymerase subunit beta [Verrucomicrobiales bacterium]